MTGDGASPLRKLGAESNIIYQICQNHGIHLAVVDTLYKKDEENEEKRKDKLKKIENDNDIFDETDVFLLPKTHKERLTNVMILNII